ncbi:DUF6538 domain-containing protein [Pandoraea soli]
MKALDFTIKGFFFVRRDGRCSTNVQHTAVMTARLLQKSRHNSVYYFRRRVPADVFDGIGKRQLYKSLDTCDRREAIIRARALGAQTDRLFATLRTMARNKPLRTYYTVKLSFNEIGLPKTLEIEAEPGEHEAAQKAVETVVAGFSNTQRPTPLPAHENAHAAPAPPNGPTLAEGVAEYLGRTDVKPTTRASYRTKLAYLVKNVGADTPLLSIDQPRLVTLVKTILADGRRHDETKGDYITIICGFLNWHRIRKGLPQLTAATLKPKRAAPAALDRDAFSIDQLGALFENAAAYRATEPHKYWATIAVAFLGCRIEELAQVNLHTDLQHDQAMNVWYFVFDESPDDDGVLRKSLKKHASWRRVPIHSVLVHHGFIEYLTTQKNEGFSRPFEAGWKPHVGKEDGGSIKWSHKITKWGGAELAKLRKAGLVPDGALAYFHSMRHTFANTLAAAKVTEEYRAALQGQAYGGINSQTYTKLRHDHAKLSETIEHALPSYAVLLDYLDLTVFSV